MPVAAEPRSRPGTEARRAAAAPVARTPAARTPASKPAARPAAKPAPRPAPRPKKAGRTATTHVARRRAARATTPRATPPRRLPTWTDLDGGAGPQPRPRRLGALDAVPSLRLAAWVLVACVGATLYMGNGNATRATHTALTEARRENLRLHLTHERLRGAFDRMTGPEAILPRAAALGLEEGVAYAPAIRLGE